MFSFCVLQLFIIIIIFYYFLAFYLIVSSEVSLNETVNDTISENEVKYLNYHLPSNTTGITLQVDVQSGKIILYVSSSTENPNEAYHEFKIITNSVTDIFINASELSNPNAERIFIALQLN